jgi:predicted phosphodiesterase
MVFVTGDTHGDPNRLNKNDLKFLNEGDTLIVCGDFGFIWDKSRAEEKILKSLSKRKYNICFIDGTHENFDLLNAYPLTMWNGGKVHQISDNIYHLMRGQIFEIDGLKIFTMGGGESPDLDARIDENPWLKYEIPSKEELLEGANNLEKHDCKIDVIITHEPSSTIKGFLKLGESEAVRVTTLNAYFDELAKCSEFKRWFFGNLHLDKYISNTYIGVHKAVINAHTGERVKF